MEVGKVVTERELVEAEREGWEALSSPRGADYYHHRLTDNALMAFPSGVMTREEAIQTMKSVPPWGSFEMIDPKIVELGQESGVVVYKVVAQRPGQAPYTAMVSSTFVRQSGQWMLAFHQQSPA